MRLHEWQARFQQGVLQPGQADGVLFESLLPGSTGKQDQFDIYRNAYVIRLVEALRSNYPALHRLLGDEDFAAMVRAFLDEHPPTRASIRWFGDALAQFLGRRAPYAGLPVLAELARFEWALRHTIDAADARVITVETLQAIAPERWGDLRFALHPSATVMALQWNTPQIWQALTAEQAPPAPENQAMHWLVHRQPDLVGGWRSVSGPELAALHCVAGGGNFSDICEAVAMAAPAPGESALRSAEILRLWVEQGLISLHDQ